MATHEPLILPSLRGWMGNWVYYSCLMPIPELSARVGYAKEVHPDEALSKLIQRSLEGARATHIAEYLGTNERFFNSLVLATYGGSPDWLEVGNFRSTSDEDVLGAALPEVSRDTLGFLRLSGSERIFALDGQHRLAGIRKALDSGNVDLADEQVPVILVAHKSTKAGLRRTRRLFTVLNKTAVPVSKSDIISLDEDDVMAITVRRLVESNASFRPPKIAVTAAANLPVSNRTSLTTISNLYDVLKLIFVSLPGTPSARSLRFNRPGEASLSSYYDFTVSYFESLAELFPPVGELMSSNDPGAVTEEYRHEEGGHVLFRPVGLSTVTRAAIEIAKKHDIELLDALRSLDGLPTELDAPPFRNVIWNPTSGSVNGKGATLAKNLILHLAGIDTGMKDLKAKYRLATDEDLESLDALRLT